MSEKKDTAFVRQWKLLQLLSETKQGLAMPEIMKQLNCGRRTIERNFTLFRELDIPLVEETGANGKKTYHVSVKPGELKFNFDEAAAVYLSRRFLDPMVGTFFWKAMQGALKKIRKCLGPQWIKHMERSAESFETSRFGQGLYRNGAEQLDELQLAVEEHRRVTILYNKHDADKPFKIKFEPYGLIFHTGSIYVVGRIVDETNSDRKIKQLKLDRMENVTLSGEKFTFPSGFNLQEHLDDQFGMFSQGDEHLKQKVRIRFTSFYAQSIQERHWHSSQRFAGQPDGSVVLEMELSDYTVLKRWVLGFGRHAEVLEPPELQGMVLEELQSMSTFYQTNRKSKGKK